MYFHLVTRKQNRNYVLENLFLEHIFGNIHFGGNIFSGNILLKTSNVVVFVIYKVKTSREVSRQNRLDKLV